MDWRTSDARRSGTQQALADGSLLGIASQDAHQAFGWLAQDTRSDHRASVTTTLRFSGCADEPHRVTWYDDVTGLALRTDAALGSSFALETPNFVKHLAIVITPG